MVLALLVISWDKGLDYKGLHNKGPLFWTSVSLPAGNYKTLSSASREEVHQGSSSARPLENLSLTHLKSFIEGKLAGYSWEGDTGFVKQS